MSPRPRSLPRPVDLSPDLGPSTFGIFDAFPDDRGRRAHLSGQVAAALKTKGAELFARQPEIDSVDVLAAKLPH